MKIDLHQNERIELGQKIKDARKQRQMSQRKLAKDCNIREQTLIDMEKGRSFNINTMLSVSRFLGLEVDLVCK